MCILFGVGGGGGIGQTLTTLPGEGLGQTHRTLYIDGLQWFYVHGRAGRQVVRIMVWLQLVISHGQTQPPGQVVLKSNGLASARVMFHTVTRRVTLG